MKYNKNLIFLFCLVCSLFFNTDSFAQLQPPDNSIISRKNEGGRVISTGVPLLLIAPDSRSGSLGDLGAASTPDANSNHWNASKLSFVEKKAGVSFTYSPWLRDIVGDIDLSYLSGYYKIDKRSTIGASLTYFSLGSIAFFDDQAISKGDYNPNEFAVDVSYSMKLTDNLSASITGRYIRSDLTQGQMVGGLATNAANAGAADIGLYYQNQHSSSEFAEPSQYAIGLQISNLGSKISYSASATEKLFLPANMRLGGRYTMNFDQFNSLSFMLDLNKLLVPTPPLYKLDEDGNVILGEIESGMNPNVNTMQGAIQSFYDAPNGFKEEMQEIMISAGLEYIYSKFLFLRAGYFYENKYKGGRQYLTLGGGFKYNVMSLDVSYLVPTVQTNNPLKNTLRLSLSFEM